MFVPADEAYPSLNLAQTAAVCLYELRRQWLKRQPGGGGLEPPASYEDQERMFAHLKEALTAVRFLWVVAGLTVLVVAAAVAYRLFEDDLMRLALVPKGEFEEVSMPAGAPISWRRYLRLEAFGLLFRTSSASSGRAVNAQRLKLRRLPTSKLHWMPMLLSDLT